MSSSLYGRFAFLDIGVPGSSGKRVQSFYVDPKTGIVTDGLRFVFKAERTSEATPNKASIQVYNLAPDTRDLLKRPKCTVTLSAGYGMILDPGTSTAEIAIQGDAYKSFTVKTGPDYVTTIEIGDGQTAYQNSTVNESYSEGATGTSVIGSLISAMGLKTGEVSGADSIQYAGSLVLSGNARDAMDDVTEKGDLEWSIQDGAVQVIPVNKFNSLEAVLLNSNTGLVGSPNLTGFNSSKGKSAASTGIEFTSLLQPSLKPGRRVRVESKFVTGVYVVRKVNIDGDTKSGPWYSKCEAIPI